MTMIIIIISNKPDLYFMYFYHPRHISMNENDRTPIITNFCCFGLPTSVRLSSMWVSINRDTPWNNMWVWVGL